MRLVLLMPVVGMVTVFGALPAYADGDDGSLIGCPLLLEDKSSGPCVEALKGELNAVNPAYGLDTSNADFDAATRIAVLDFQGRNHLEADGNVGSVTAEELQRQYEALPGVDDPVVGGGESTAPPGSNPGYPSGFDPAGAAAWAVEHVDDISGADFRGDDVDNHCTEFVSAALHVGGGLKYTGSWHPGKTGLEYRNQKAYYVTNSFKGWLLSKKTWVNQVDLNLGDGLSAGNAGAQPGDIIYYSWDGQNSAQDSHVAIVVQSNGFEITVADQGEGATHNKRFWDMARSQPDKHIRDLEPQSTAVLLKWNR